MSGRTLLLIAVVLAALFMVDRYQRNPHRTALPFGSTDLSGVQEQLAALPPEERQLVEDYVKRSRGDVLTPALADPDDPLTARTFAEAITLQRAWQARMKVEEARMEKLNAQRDARLAPLRALVDARVVRAETLTSNEFGARRDPNYFPQPERAGDGLIFVTRIQVRNIGNESIVKVKGSLKARDSEAYLPLDLCWIDLGEDTPLLPGASHEFDCGNPARRASDQETAFVENPEDRFTVEWTPRSITLADGRELDSGE